MKTYRLILGITSLELLVLLWLFISVCTDKRLKQTEVRKRKDLPTFYEVKVGLFYFKTLGSYPDR